MGNVIPVEIEHKYLIRMPDSAQLSAFAVERIDMIQSYLTSGRESFGRRVRRSETKGIVEYTYTRKRQISPLVREEVELAISAEEYKIFLKEADINRKSLSKTRWIIPHNEHLLEIDIYSFWSDRAILEIELSHEGEAFDIPAWIDVIREVSNDPRYYNASLAQAPVYDNI